MRVAVIGAGLMGHAIALVWAMGGHTVRLTDSSAETLERAQGLMEKAIATLTEYGENKGFDAAMLAQAVTRHTSLEETVEGAELIVEAIIENPEAKRTLYTELEKLAPANATIASNTSYLDVFPLMPPALLKRALIAHWYTPPYLVDLVDLVPSEELEPGRLEAVQVALNAMGQVPVVMKRFIPGYIANRIQAAVQNEVQWLIDNGYADAQMVDAAVVHGIALRMPIVGVMAKADFTGLPLLQHTFRNKMYTPPVAFESSPSMDALIAEGATGVMSGRGYYEWGEEPAKLFEERDRKLIALKKSLREIGTMAGFRK
ncbi:3-hydroxyacyl-CoA dehydrogenase family protein [Sabulicella glaciei]|uniref:L-gulonate 3-dehydrogenase n=1 Tax=Sabulicella glaciei TaxID=2984948 RepID=A0ABT3NS52_9PROT|nr:3-hydroxyacyl-CoA dehydrogenase family protein [Roseococcus sp. MDT2-1-1]MCW8084986.1 3-hydroxyacyl-CoA dehydrogenase family protein [Roseococcus sp. MDT2-1-1]